MSIILTILAFNFIIIIHELGHFVVAKLADIRVIEFSLFVGPKIFSIQRGETTYSLRLLPFLAYVKMEGEDEEAKSERSFGKKSLLTRAAVIAAGPLANLLSALIIFTIVFSYTGYSTTKIAEMSADSSAKNAGLMVGDIITKYDNKSVYGPTNMMEFLYVSKGKPFEIEVKRNGEKINKVITPQIMPKNRYLIGVKTIESSGEKATVISEVEPNSPIGKAGILKNDKILKINNIKIKSIKEIIDFMTINKGSPIQIIVLRDGVEKVFNDIVPIQGTNDESYDLGIGYNFEKGSILGATKQAIVSTYSTTRSVVYTLKWLIQGQVSVKQLSGPVGIATTMNEAAAQGENNMQKILNLLFMTGYISVAIGATNLIPFPALDGSKLLLILVEAIRRKPLPVEKEAFITMVGFTILIVLAVFTTTNDIFKVFTR